MSNKCNSLVVLWRSSVEKNGPLADGIRAMNDHLETRYTNSRVNEWQDERQKLPKKAARYMLGIVLPSVIKSHDIGDDKADEIAKEIFDLIPE